MNREEALLRVKKHLTEHRYTHTVGVMNTAIQLAEHYGVNAEKAELAAIFHDYAKFRPKDEMQQIVKQEDGLPLDLLDFGTELLHAPVGAFLVRKEVGIRDEEVLSAIFYHTTGRKEMTKLEKVIFLADYIEPNRHFPGVDEVRDLAKNNLEQACMQAVKNTIMFLMKQNQKIYPLTLETYNGLIQEIKRMNKQEECME